jgi:hypothetical protein
MHCYGCFQADVTRDAVGLCHHCSVALCTEHACMVTDPLTEIYPVMQTVVLPKRARLLLCGMCKAALDSLDIFRMLSGTQDLARTVRSQRLNYANRHCRAEAAKSSPRGYRSGTKLKLRTNM